MGFFSKLFGVDESDTARRDVDVPVTVTEVCELEVAFWDFDPSDRDWLETIAPQLLQSYWPDFMDAITQFNPNVSFVRGFAESSERSIALTVQRAAQLNAVLYIQPHIAIIANPTKGPTEYNFSLSVFVRGGDITVHMAANHRIVPET